ncbi:MAG TPA: amino acid adenylation domain-containing protein [Verrucomicrobiales bacterium]|nr:amino acid adenylation domain-containing protein [Verrucomicrobiales bacterium]
MAEPRDPAANLSLEARALLEKRLLLLQARRPSSQTIRRRSLLPLSPLSFAQQRLWFLDRMEPGLPLYNIPIALRLSGPLDASLLERSLREIVRRHQVLRTTFPAEKGEPVQRIHPDPNFTLSIVSLLDLPETEREFHALRKISEEAVRPFDLSSDLMLRAALFRLTEGEHFLLLVLHHIAADGWSLHILFRELSLLYQAFAAGESFPLPDLPIQYADYASWQRELLESDAIHALVDYWRKQLEGAPGVLDLPFSQPRSHSQNHRGARCRLTLSRQLTQGLQALSRRHDATLFMTLLAAFNVLLCRYTERDDILVGSPIAGRDRSEVEGLVGFFVNTLVLRASLSGDPSFPELLRRVRDVTLGAYSHQNLPFEKLVEILQPERRVDRSPLVQILFALQNIPQAPLELPDIAVQSQELELASAKFDLSLGIEETAEGLTLAAAYSTSLFEAADIRRMLDHYLTLLDGIVSDPDRPIGTLPLLTQFERRQILEVWSGASRAAVSSPLCLHQFFEAQAARTPEALAVDFRGQQLTYDELNRRANRLAHRLISMGAGPEQLAGILMERSLDLLVGILAILKSGSAYVALDPKYPPARLAFMLEDAAATLLLTQTSLAGQWRDHAGAVVCVDDGLETVAPGPDCNPPNRAAPGNLAYVIYTSGSTGKPKGVAIEHQNAAAFLAWVHEVFPAEQIQGVLFSTSICFDLSIFEIFAPLSCGGAVILVENFLELPSLRSLEPVTLVNTVPSAISELLKNTRMPLSVSTVNLAGERLTNELVRRIYQEPSIERVYDLYGPSEDTTYSTYALRSADGPYTIGRPITGTQVYLLDDHLQPVPAGVPGELYIGGSGLARGYLNRPSLTAERFVPNPLPEAQGGRLYRTGDRCRWRPDGSLELLGRNDHQVKLRGFRIELGEIESAIREDPAVRESVVILRRDDPGDPRLVAYLTAEDGQGPTAKTLRSRLRLTLSEHMIPSAFVVLTALPLTANGKVDRAALPSPLPPPPDRKEPVAPRSNLESRLLLIWSEALGRTGIGVRDNFFDAGGHSLLLLQVHSRIVEELGYDITVLELFQHPTIDSLAARLSADDSVNTAAPPRPETHKPRPRPSADASIALLAMNGRFPGASNVAALWESLCAGAEGIRTFSGEELLAAGVDPSLLTNPAYVKARGIIDGADLFDAEFFGYTPREAQWIDPQQRLFLECAWEALETAGCDPDRYDGLIGVYAGATTNSYLDNLLSNPEILAEAGLMQCALAANKDFLTSRVAYKLNLRGPAVNVQSTCSTSLVAIHMACQSLIQGECDLALAGGVAISVPVVQGYLYQEGGIASPDGHCRAFDARAQGVVQGNGVALVVLKRLADALAGGDSIRAVIRGSAVNNDGGLKVGFTAPSIEGQAQVIALAQSLAGIHPDSIGFVEAHGTGTKLGDPIEIAALAKAFRRRTSRRGFCALGSIKSNLGHLNESAGAAGFIKAALCLEHQRIPPSLHFHQPNPALDLENSPFFVNSQCLDWRSSSDTPRRAAVSSFGLGGTNAHALLEEAPPLPPSIPGRDRQLWVVSARTAPELETSSSNLAQHLRSHPDISLADAAFTLQTGRRAFDHRRAFVARNHAEVLAALDGPAPHSGFRGCCPGGTPPAVFLFPGQGTQHAGMTRKLYSSEPAFREVVDACLACLRDDLDLDLRPVLYPDDRNLTDAHDRLQRTALAQPALFVVEYALAQLWRSWGIEPAACIGHSAGEYVAACISGVLHWKDALRLVTIRGRLMEDMPEGVMLAVPLSEQELSERLRSTPGLWIAAVNAPALSVVSGLSDRIANFESQLNQEGIAGRRLHTSHAFHSGLMDQAAAAFAEAAKDVAISPPQIPYPSNLTGRWITEQDLRDPAYWARHIRQTVRFGEGLSCLLENPRNILLEVGPGRVLTSLARQHPRCGPDRLVIPSLPGPQDTEDDIAALLSGLARLWTAGATVDWGRFHESSRRRRVGLPTYPFTRQRYWVDKPPRAAAPSNPTRSLSEWFSVRAWRPDLPRPLKRAPETGPRRWLFFLDGSALALRLCAYLGNEGSAIPVTPGRDFGWIESGFQIDPANRDHYQRLLAELHQRDAVPTDVVHFWNEDVPDPRSPENLAPAFFSLLYLVQALGALPGEPPVRITAVTDRGYSVAGDEEIQPEAAQVLGLCRVASLELSNVDCRNVDLSKSDWTGAVSDEAFRLLTEEMLTQDWKPVVAHRRARRWIEAFVPIRLPPISQDPPARLRQGGTYLITGGLGGIGLAIADYLARRLSARLVLTGRSALPNTERWSEILSTNDAGHDPGITEKLRSIAKLKEAGAEVMAVQAGVSDLISMQKVIADAEKCFGPIHGVVHAAGIPGDGIILLKDPALAVEVLKPKIAGTQVLGQLIAGMDLDFFLLCSSLNSLAGAPGTVDYAAANAYLDAFARRFQADTGIFTVSVNWCRWREAGMAARAAAPSVSPRQAGISNAEGVEAFLRILDSCPDSQVAVSEVDLNSLLAPRDQPEKFPSPAAAPEALQAAPDAASSPPVDARARLSTAYVPPDEGIERRIAEIWERLFGIAPLGANDDFFELGGHSLLAVQLLSRLREVNPNAALTLPQFFDNSTVRRLATLLGAAPENTPGPD